VSVGVAVGVSVGVLVSRSVGGAPAVVRAGVGAVAGAPPAEVSAGDRLTISSGVEVGLGVTVTVVVAVAVAVTVSIAGERAVHVRVPREPSGAGVQDAVVSIAPARVVTPRTRVTVVPAASRARLP